MAGLTSDLGMFAIESVLGLLVVIEVPQGPGPRVVTVLTKRTQLLLVLILLLVAAQAITCRILVASALMASLAGRRHMTPGEREPGQPMVKLFNPP